MSETHNTPDLITDYTRDGKILDLKPGDTMTVGPDGRFVVGTKDGEVYFEIVGCNFDTGPQQDTAFVVGSTHTFPDKPVEWTATAVPSDKAPVPTPVVTVQEAARVLADDIGFLMKLGTKLNGHKRAWGKVWASHLVAQELRAIAEQEAE